MPAGAVLRRRSSEQTLPPVRTGSSSLVDRDIHGSGGLHRRHHSHHHPHHHDGDSHTYSLYQYELQLLPVYGWLTFPYVLLVLTEILLFMFIFLDPAACAPSKENPSSMLPLTDDQRDFVNTMCANEVRGSFNIDVVVVALHLFIAWWLLAYDADYASKVRTAVRKYGVLASEAELGEETAGGSVAALHHAAAAAASAAGAGAPGSPGAPGAPGAPGSLAGGERSGAYATLARQSGEIMRTCRRLTLLRVGLLATFLLSTLIVSVALFVTFARNDVSRSLAFKCGGDGDGGLAEWQESYAAPAGSPVLFNCAARNGSMVKNLIALVFLARIMFLWRLASAMYALRSYSQDQKWIDIATGTGEDHTDTAVLQRMPSFDTLLGLAGQHSSHSSSHARHRRHHSKGHAHDGPRRHHSRGPAHELQPRTSPSLPLADGGHEYAAHFASTREAVLAAEVNNLRAALAERSDGHRRLDAAPPPAMLRDGQAHEPGEYHDSQHQPPSPVARKNGWSSSVSHNQPPPAAGRHMVRPEDVEFNLGA